MFENLTARLGQTLRNWTGKGKLTTSNIQPALQDIRAALLDADVALEVVKDFITHIEELAVGQDIPEGLAANQFLVKLVNQALVELMGSETQGLNFHGQQPAVILLAGLQGAGKTTLIGKLAKWIKENDRKSVVIATCDTQRAAAREQLKVLSEQVGAKFFEPESFNNAATIATQALEFARKQVADVLLLDTAGRLHVDQELMDEIHNIHKLVNPIETLFVVDSMLGQDAANSAREFGARLPLTGVVLTKIDGDARGGAALSVRKITGKPIKFLSTGEKLDALEVFHPDRIASRILGMGDVLSLVEEIERKIDKTKADKLAKKLKAGRDFDLEDLREQLQQMNNMGGMAGMAGMMSKLPGMSGLTDKIQDQMSAANAGGAMTAMIAVIDSMTMKERRRPLIINGSRKRRIAMGSGTSIPMINKVLKQHAQMQKMMKKASSKGGMMNMMRGLQSRLPPGMQLF